MTTPDEALIWARADQISRCPGPITVAMIEAGNLDHELTDLARGYRAGQSAAAERVAELEAENAKLREALIDARDVLLPAATPAKIDPDRYFVDGVRAHAEIGGYGALMATASALWRGELEAYGLAGGEFAAGPCVATAANCVARITAALGGTDAE